MDATVVVATSTSTTSIDAWSIAAHDGIAAWDDGLASRRVSDLHHSRVLLDRG